MADCEVVTKENGLTSKHGHKLFCKYWKPKEKNGKLKTPRCLIFLCHGYAEHCERKTYNVIATSLAQNGFFIFSHDHVGHGKSEGDRVHIENFNIYIDDVVSHIEDVKKEFKNIPLFILGHSMGGLITILTAIRIPDSIKGIVVSSPALCIDKKVATPFKLFLAKIAGTLFPQMAIGSLPPEHICKNPEMVREYKEDKLIWHESSKAKWVNCTFAAMDEAKNGYVNMRLPYLLIHGSSDLLCDIEGSKIFHEKSGSLDKTFKIYEGGYHEVFNDNDGPEQFIDDVNEWVNKRL